ncbi:DUF1761 domain-containing protein [Thalassococcus sp. CAU 1522]|uniref:DUF1761 domain-containing protein n=1 Tax=Thalassococcus arenae TaxID=2851652 RepID=A0ABS6N684_9RHOB|nr:DUF1761 domain-containing protein [Thalassococcus arenae]MBV2359519.1 DUF1761 domain-containing protein [Thalassococcus arenae]
MGLISVLAAAAASWAFGAVWYMALARPWMAASGVAVGADGKPANSSNPMPFVVSLACAVLVAGMMRHNFALSGVDTVGKGLVSGLGIGLFLATPWIATNYAFAGRPARLTLIDGGYATIGCAIMGLVLTLL